MDNPAPMTEVSVEQPNEAFVALWNAALSHLDRCGRDGNLGWVRADLDPPALDHLSFLIGNQLFHVRVEDARGRVKGPGSREDLARLANETGGHACILQMEMVSSSWLPLRSGWGLASLEGDQAIVPENLVTDHFTVISEWELYDLALIRVRAELEQQGAEVLFWARWDASAIPSIFYQLGDTVEWAVVRAVRFPEQDATPPQNFRAIQQQLAERGFPTGHFISVSVADAEDPLDEDALNNHNYLPLLRGHQFLMKLTRPVLAD